VATCVRVSPSASAWSNVARPLYDPVEGVLVERVEEAAIGSCATSLRVFRRAGNDRLGLFDRALVARKFVKVVKPLGSAARWSKVL
jgi:hypothetical protein